MNLIFFNNLSNSLRGGSGNKEKIYTSDISGDNNNEMD